MKTTNSLRQKLRKDGYKWAAISAVIGLAIIVPLIIFYLKIMAERNIRMQVQAGAEVYRSQILTGNVRAAEISLRKLLRLSDSERVKIVDENFSPIFKNDEREVVQVCVTSTGCWTSDYRRLVAAAPIFFDEEGKSLFGYLVIETHPVIDDSLFILLFLGFILLQGIFIFAYHLGIKRIGDSLSNQVSSVIEQLKSEITTDEPPAVLDDISEFEIMRKSVKDLNAKVLLFRDSEFNENNVKQVAHDIRSPLTAIRFAAGSAAGLPEDTRRILEKASQRIELIAADLLKRRAQKTEGVPFPRTNFILNDLLKNIINEKRVEYPDRNNEFIFNNKIGTISLNLPEPSQLGRVISNLINNSVQALSRSSGVVSLNLDMEGQWLALTVADNGQGMPEPVIENLFTRGYTTNTATGNGLGLWGAKEFVESHDGKISIQSRVEMGTIVKLRLPAALVSR